MQTTGADTILPFTLATGAAGFDACSFMKSSNPQAPGESPEVLLIGIVIPVVVVFMGLLVSASVSCSISFF